MSSNKQIAWFFTWMVSGICIAIVAKWESARLLGWLGASLSAWLFMHAFMTAMRPSDVPETTSKPAEQPE